MSRRIEIDLDDRLDISILVGVHRSNPNSRRSGFVTEGNKPFISHLDEEEDVLVVNVAINSHKVRSYKYNAVTMKLVGTEDHSHSKVK